MAVKLFLDNILLLDVYSFKVFWNRIKMMKWWTIIQIPVTSSDLKKYTNIAKDC